MADMQGISKLLHVVCMQNGQGPPVLELHRALIISVPLRAAGTRHDHISPKGANTVDSLSALLGKPEHKWMPEVSRCLKFKHQDF